MAFKVPAVAKPAAGKPAAGGAKAPGFAKPAAGKPAAAGAKPAVGQVNTPSSNPQRAISPTNARSVGVGRGGSSPTTNPRGPLGM